MVRTEEERSVLTLNTAPPSPPSSHLQQRDHGCLTYEYNCLFGSEVVEMASRIAKSLDLEHHRLITNVGYLVPRGESSAAAPPPTQRQRRGDTVINPIVSRFDRELRVYTNKELVMNFVKYFKCTDFKLGMIGVCDADWTKASVREQFYANFPAYMLGKYCYWNAVA